MLWVALHFPQFRRQALSRGHAPPEPEREALAAVAAWACQFTPRVSLEPPQAREFFVPPARFTARLVLPAPVMQADRTLFVARRLLDQMEGFLAARHAGTRSFSLYLLHDDLPETKVKVGLAACGRDAKHF